MNGRISAWIVSGGFHKRLSIERKELLQNTERGDAQVLFLKKGIPGETAASKINHVFCTRAHYFRSQYARVQRLGACCSKGTVCQIAGRWCMAEGFPDWRAPFLTDVMIR